MYEERRNKFSLRDIILQILLVVLFVFIMIWLFPTKSYLEEKNAIGTNELYTNYITNMTEAAKSYFTKERMPINVGDSVKLTLAEMLEQKLMLEIGGNASCDLQKSYVRVTKMETDYQLRVELSCTDYSNYVVVTIGCYDFCDDCEVETTTPETKPNPKPTTQPTQQSTKKYTVTFDSNGGSAVSNQTVVSGKTATKPTNPTKEGHDFVEWTLNGVAYDFSKAVTSDITLVAKWESKALLYQYSKDASNYSDWSDWSETKTYWGTFKYENTDVKEYKIVSSGTANNGETKKTCTTKTETVTAVVDTQKVVTTSKTYEAPSLLSVGSEYVWKVVDTEFESDVPLKEYYKGNVISTSSEADTRYQFVKTQLVSVCEGCTNKIQYVYKKSSLVEETVETYSCPTGYKKTGTGINTKCTKVQTTSSCASYGSDYKLENGKCVKYGTKEVAKETCTDTPVKSAYTKYQFRTRTFNGTSADIQWSESANDATLISQGYKYTGVTKVK